MKESLNKFFGNLWYYIAILKPFYGKIEMMWLSAFPAFVDGDEAFWAKRNSLPGRTFPTGQDLIKVNPV